MIFVHAFFYKISQGQIWEKFEQAGAELGHTQGLV